MEYQREFYQLGHGGDLRFEKDLKQLVEYQGQPYPEFFGIPLKNHSGEPPRWEVSTDLRRKLGAPVWETIWFSVTGNTWKEGLVRAMQEAIARLCGQNENKIRNSRFIYYPRHDSLGRSMTMPPPTERNPMKHTRTSGDREAERAERQANLAALQQIAQNNQGHGNHDHPGSKLKNFQNTNPPMFSKTEEPLDADDWLQTMENNLEVAGVEAAVLFATHYLSGPARAWWTSARAMNAGQMMTWEDFKLKFSKYHVPQGPIKKMRDEFHELKQGRMSVVEYRDRFLTLSRYAPDETDTNEKRKERFLNGLHDEMQTVSEHSVR
ncbi:hypothetical protein QYE76_051901 [Lolium multiflorum]|uniref:Retrotransposon gag domain-containing protein n=1 Tax=Lolium multiflorum TaxID=4521 RepID=A0AAD8WID3_LOLMU|nr:hypothetical protein QYE76_051901 [Lolium multiflorum]